MKKALIIAYNDLNNSGVPNVIYQTIRALSDRYSFDVLVFGDNDFYFKKLLSNGININLIKYKEDKPKNKIYRLFWWFYKRPHSHYLFAKQLFEKEKYFVVHSFKEYDSWPFFKAAKRAGIKKRIFHSNVNLNVHKKSKYGFLAKHNTKLTIRYSSLLVGVSELSCKNAFKDNKYYILHNTYDDIKFNFSVSNKLEDNKLVITHVASYSENKNQLFSLLVFKELKKMYSNSKLNLVGASELTPYYKKLISFVSENNLEHYVSFVGKSDCVDKYFENTTFVLLPSFSEGLPLTAIESQACGITVFISTNVTREVDCGGAIFLDLSRGPEYWANEIYRKFLLVNNQRTEYDLSKFSFNYFRSQLEKLYDN